MKAHLIGIGGYGMKILAFFLKGKGYEVTGSDISYTPSLRFLSSNDIKVWSPHNIGLLSKENPDIIIYSLAVKDDNIELNWAYNNSKPIYTRTQMLVNLLPKDRSIGITGTDGKTTTTSMVAKIFLTNNKPYNLYVGGDTPYFSENISYSSDRIFISEIDESDPDFKLFSLTASIITNINYDHLENYANNRQKQLQSFKEFVNKSHVKVLNHNLKDFFVDSKNVHTFAIDRGELHVKDVRFYDFSSEFTVVNGNNKFKAKLNVPYFHNIENALAASLVSLYFGISLKDSFDALYFYRGVKRRFEIKFRNESKNLYIIDDYAHNPREVAHTVKAAKIKGYDLWVIFQPHRYSRFKAHWRDFAESLKDADKIIITDIFGAYENNGENVSPILLKKALSSMGKHVYYMESFSDIKNFVFKYFKRNAVLLTLGAGTVTNLCDDIAKIYV